MNGFKAYKYYMAVKLHFTSDKFNVFENGGRVKGSIEAFKKRADRFHFDHLATKIPTDRDMIQFYVANFAYGFNEPVWSQEEAQKNYKTWLKRKESIAYFFKRDLDTIILHAEKENLQYYHLLSWRENVHPEVMKLYIGGYITIESMSILNDFTNYIDDWKKVDTLKLLWSGELRRIEKIKGFIKYNPEKLKVIYDSFLSDIPHDEI